MEFLDLAARLASEVDWRDVYPNPRVGCVIVQNGKVVSTGVHEKCGGAHAEVKALENLKLQTTNYKLQTSNNEEASEGGFKSELEVYITLEPCDDFPGKKTGSCTEQLLKLSPEKVVIGAIDKRFGGKNVEKLRAAGIDVEVVNHEQSADLSRMKPHVILKMAQTLDGKISKGGKKDIISSQKSRKKVHQLRSEVDGILTTTSTISRDDPFLDCRLANKKCVPGLLVFGEAEADKDKKIFQFPERKVAYFSGEDLDRDMREISEMGVKTVLTECGATMATSLLRENLVDAIWMFVAPRIFGKGVGVFAREVDLSDFGIQEIEQIGGDVLIKFVKKS